LIYTQLVSFESDEFMVRVAKTLKEACELAEAGFEYFTYMTAKRYSGKESESITFSQKLSLTY